MNSRGLSIYRKVWELVELCSEKHRRCRRVNIENFRNACDGWDIGREEVYAALHSLERSNYLLTMTRGEDDEITDIVITPPTYRCLDCRLMVSSHQDWEDHLPDCLRQQKKQRRVGRLV